MRRLRRWQKNPRFGLPSRNAAVSSVATGFYEWQVRGAVKQPICIGLRSHQPFALAGLWEHWKPVPILLRHLSHKLYRMPNGFIQILSRRARFVKTRIRTVLLG